jgi:transposase
MELKVLHQHGWSISALAREFGLSRNTVRRELAADGPRCYPERAKPTELTEAQFAHIQRRLTVCPTIRGSDLWAELRADYGYQGSYPAFTRHLRTLRRAAQVEPEVRFETDPGVQIQMDWAHFGLLPLEDALVDLFGMVAILGCSRAPSVRFATDRTRPTALERIVACLADLGGVPKEVLTDRDPVFCSGSTSDGRAMLAPEWVELCQTLDVVPKACRPYRAKTKGKVERVIREIKESFLPWLSGQILPAQPSLDVYDRLAEQWREQVVLPRVHRTTKKRVGDAWLEERPVLSPLPAHLLPSDPRRSLHPLSVIDLTQRRLGEVVETRELTEYEVAL